MGDESNDVALFINDLSQLGPPISNLTKWAKAAKEELWERKGRGKKKGKVEGRRRENTLRHRDNGRAQWKSAKNGVKQ